MIEIDGYFFNGNLINLRGFAPYTQDALIKGDLITFGDEGDEVKWLSPTYKHKTRVPMRVIAGSNSWSDCWGRCQLLIGAPYNGLISDTNDLGANIDRPLVDGMKVNILFRGGTYRVSYRFHNVDDSHLRR